MQKKWHIAALRSTPKPENLKTALGTSWAYSKHSYMTLFPHSTNAEWEWTGRACVFMAAFPSTIRHSADMTRGLFQIAFPEYESAFPSEKCVYKSLTPLFVVIYRIYRWKSPIRSSSSPCQHRIVLYQTFIMILFRLVLHVPSKKAFDTSLGSSFHKLMQLTNRKFFVQTIPSLLISFSQFYT